MGEVAVDSPSDDDVTNDVDDEDDEDDGVVMTEVDTLHPATVCRSATVAALLMFSN